MILSLQKRHRQIWTVFAIVLPVLFVMSYFYIPAQPINPATTDYSLFPMIYNEKEDAKFKIIERKLELEEEIKYQLQVIVKEPIRESSTLIYISENDKITDKIPVGQVFSKGSYTLKILDPLQKNDRVIFYNPITKKIFHRL